MADYKDIKGFHVQSLSTDPAASAAAGGSWASAPAINTGRHSAGGAGVTQSAAYIIGGKTSTAISALNEQYNGTAWTEAADLGTAKYLVATFGTTTSACTAGGYNGVPPTTTPQGYTTQVESWNGSSWTETTDINTIRGNAGASGASNTSGVVYGGHFPTGNQAVTESWNGSAWTETGDLNTARADVGQTNNGTATAAMASGGGSPVKTNVEQFNGSSWTEVSDINTARFGAWGIGTTTLALIAGGRTPSYVAKTETWDGSSWSEGNDLGTASNTGAASGGGTTTAGIIAGQYTGSITTLSEEWSAPATFQKTNEGQVYYNSSSTNAFKLTSYSVPGGAWTSGGNLNTSRGYFAGVGTQTAGQVSGGSPYSSPPKAQLNELYDGTSWTESGDLTSGHSAGSSAGSTNTASITFCGGPPPSGVKNESWDGTNWTEVGDLNTNRNNGPAGFGSQTAAICSGGNNPPITTTESWDGSSWTAVNSMNNGRRNFAGTGSSTSGIVACGQGPGGVTNNSETWDGTSWTETNNCNTSRRGNTMFGAVNTSAFCTGGGGPEGENEFFNGTSWTEMADLATARGDSGASGSSVAGFVAGGPQSGGSATEEWTSSLSNLTITVS